MRKARCAWVLIGFSIVSAAYFLLIIRDEHSEWLDTRTGSRVRQALFKSEHLLSNTKVYYHNCPEDPEFVASINNTAYGHQVEGKTNNVVYVSVPKCGSRTFVWVAWILKDKNNISAITDLPYLLANSEENKMKSLLTEKLQSVPPGGLFHGHIRFIGFTNPAMMPVYVSMLRDPLARHVSWYYFMRFGDADMDVNKLHEMIVKEGVSAVNQTYDECVERGRPSCTGEYYTNINIRTFCGYEEKCITSPEYALEQAKRNLDNFLVVGIVEEYESFLRVIERLLPSMFGGAIHDYQANKDEFSAVSKTSFKKMPSARSVEIMKERMKLDYEFYDYVKERFHKLKRHLGVDRCI
ncbi:uronyl 2-sulfotransferase [Strongylocentrotus purpuratus]|uniref:Uronyl 2-sulfotransferase n=1 Tax=Strongylocentrotus purpuratus TaxID=7668 RepID=A0A7M7HMH2_STRPU|nr:uronyl 2-sulfotransferase [Strongylocentrotus purpuratus]XP_792962.2 uronyl 2-sulfotransferase [Strongylocentrotus purpuratus]